MPNRSLNALLRTSFVIVLTVVLPAPTSGDLCRRVNAEPSRASCCMKILGENFADQREKISGINFLQCRGSGKKKAADSGSLSSVSRQRLSEARMVLEYAPHHWFKLSQACKVNLF
jgi:hypothetical protein